jgi:hypothetical protein
MVIAAKEVREEVLYARDYTFTFWAAVRNRRGVVRGGTRVSPMDLNIGARDARSLKALNRTVGFVEAVKNTNDCLCHVRSSPVMIEAAKAADRDALLFFYRGAFSAFAGVLPTAPSSTNHSPLAPSRRSTTNSSRRTDARCTASTSAAAFVIRTFLQHEPHFCDWDILEYRHNQRVAFLAGAVLRGHWLID